MDLHAEFENSIKRFPSLHGLIFADYEGESILYENPHMDVFDIKLAGCKMPILMDSYQFAGADESPRFMELSYSKTFVLSIMLQQKYSITLVCGDLCDKGRLKNHLMVLAEKFNQEIV